MTTTPTQVVTKRDPGAAFLMGLSVLRSSGSMVSAVGGSMRRGGHLAKNVETYESM